MRRPVCLPAASFAAGILFKYNPQLNIFIILIPLCAIISILILKIGDFKKLKKAMFIVLIFFIAGSCCCLIHENKKDDMLSLIDREAVIQGVVCSIQKKSAENHQLIVKTENGRSKILINIYGDFGSAGLIEKYGDLAGRHVEISGKIELPSERRNPGMFDYRLYLRAKGVAVIMNIKPYDIAIMNGEVNIFLNTVSNIRHDFSNGIVENMAPENAGIFLGMLFGDKTLIEDDLYEIFQKNGTAHILAVSGIHIGIVYLLLNRLINARRNIYLNIILLLFLFLYAALASFSPSVIRAGGMIALHIFSRIFCMRYDMLSAGAAMALSMMFINPFVIFDIGFQLSFLAIFILAITLPAAQRVYCGSIMTVISLQIGLAPITAYTFNYFSLAAFFINIPVVLIASVIIPVGIILIPLFYLPGPIFPVCMGFADALCGIMYGLNEFTSRGNMFFNATSPPLWFVFLFYGLLLFGCSEAAWIFLKRNANYKLSGAVAVIIILSFITAFSATSDLGRAQLIFVDVGQGDCLHIRTPSGKNILIDGGGNYNFDVGKKVLAPYLLKNGVRKIDVALVTHRHLDHYGGIVSLANKFNIGKLCLYEANRTIEGEILNETGLKSEQIMYLVKGQKIILDKEVWIEILYPARKTADEYAELAGEGADENENSLIIKVCYYNLSVLMTGDIAFDGENRLMSAFEDNMGILKCDILKIPHHGSKYSCSDEFIAEVNPAFVVFQVGKNNFGHPAAATIDKCINTGAEVYRNDKQGAICVFIKKNRNEPLIKTMI